MFRCTLLYLKLKFFCTLIVQLLNDAIDLDARPEYVRASVSSIGGQLHAHVTGNQVRDRQQNQQSELNCIHVFYRSAAACRALWVPMF